MNLGVSFAWPHLLWLLFVPVALLVTELLTRRRRAAAGGRPKLLRAEAGARTLQMVSPLAGPLSTRRTRFWLCAGLALAVVALARPQWGRIEEQVFDQSREILLAVDLSRSMLAQDVKPSRLDRAKLLIQSLLERLEGERVGLVVFSGTAFLQSPLSSDYEILREFLPALNPDYLPEGGTNYHALLDTTVQAFSSGTAADRFLIVLSDGEATDDNWKSAVDSLKDKGIRVIGLGVGTTAGAMIPDGSGGFVKDDRGAVVLSKLENTTLQELARATNGTYQDASTWIDLPALLQTTVEAGRKGDFVDKTQVRLIERFQYFLAPALLCLLLSFYFEFPVPPRPRELVLQTDARGQKSEAATKMAAALLMVALLAGLVSPRWARGADDGGDPLVAPLSKVVGRLSSQSNHAAADWAELGRTTLTYGQRLQSSKQAVPEGPVRDALAGVDAGASLDAKAANWPQLRQDLEALLKRPEDEKQNPPPQQQKQPEQNQSQQNQQQQQQQQQDQKDQQKESEQQNQSQSRQQPQQQKSQEKDANNDQKQDNSQSQPQPPPPPQGKQGQSAFGDMKADQPPKIDRQPPGESQKVGGAPEKKPEEKQDLDPALLQQLQKLDQVRNQDSPAKLFQLMEGEPKKSDSPKGKNW